MYTDKSLKHLKSKDRFLIAKLFRETLRAGHLIIFRQLGSAEEVFWVRKEAGTLLSPQRSKRGQYKPGDDFDEVVIRNNVQELYTHRHQLLTMNNLLSVLKMASCHNQNSNKQETVS